MDHFILPAWLAKAIYAVGIATILGGGATVLNTSRDVAVLQSSQHRIESTIEKRLDRIETKLDRALEDKHEHPAENYQ